MRVIGYTVEYETPQGARAISVESAGRFETQDIVLEFSAEDGVVALTAKANCQLRVTACVVRCEHTFARDERIVVNGYQSWTDSRPLKPGDRLRGLAGIPRRIVAEHALDAIGDYHFVDYSNIPGVFHGFTYASFTAGGRTWLVASLDDSAGFTRIDVDARRGAVILAPEAGREMLEPGQQPCLLRAFIAEGYEHEVYERWARLYRAEPRRMLPAVGYSSWYRHFADIDERRIKVDLAGAKRAFARLQTGDAVRVFQIDDGWCTVGDWDHADRVKFPQGLAPLAQEAVDAGFVPGLWLAPFVCTKGSELMREHPEWLLRDIHGAPVKTGSHWNGAYALDLCIPDVRAYIERVLRTAVEDWGFGFLKLDFLYAACLAPRSGTKGAAMREAAEFLRACVGDDVLIDACGVPLASVFGLVDYCRIGCDVGLDWNDKPYMRLLHRERISTKHSLGNTLARAPIDGLMFGNDPDVVFLRDDVRMSASQKQRLLTVDARCASMLMTSDDMGDWGPRELSAFQTAIDTLLERKGSGIHES